MGEKATTKSLPKIPWKLKGVLLFRTARMEQTLRRSAADDFVRGSQAFVRYMGCICSFWVPGEWVPVCLKIVIIYSIYAVIVLVSYRKLKSKR